MQLLAARLHHDLHSGLTRLLGGGEFEPCLAAREQLRKYLRQLLVRSLEGRLKALARRPRQLGDRAPQILERTLEIIPLPDEKLPPATQLFELLDRCGIDVTQSGEPLAERLGALRAVRAPFLVNGDLRQGAERKTVPLSQLRGEVLERHPLLGECHVEPAPFLSRGVEPFLSRTLLHVVVGQDRVGGMQGDQQALVLRSQLRRAFFGGRAVRLALRRLVTRTGGSTALVGHPGSRGYQPLVELPDPLLEARALGACGPQSLARRSRPHRRVGPEPLGFRVLLPPARERGLSLNESGAPCAHLPGRAGHPFVELGELAGDLAVFSGHSAHFQRTDLEFGRDPRPSLLESFTILLDRHQLDADGLEAMLHAGDGGCHLGGSLPPACQHLLRLDDLASARSDRLLQLA